MIRTAIEKLKEGNFQDFIDTLFLKKYNTDFVPTKQKRDKGCDGILYKKIIIAAYAPETSANLKKFKKKCEEDYKKYEDNWKSQYPEWWFIYNGEITGPQIQFFNSSYKNSQCYGIKHIMLMIDELSKYDIHDIASILGIDEQYITNNMIKNVVEDLFKLCSKNDINDITKIEHKPPTYIKDKIIINFENEIDIEQAEKEYYDSTQYFSVLKGILKSYDNIEIAALKRKIMSSFKKFSGSFKKRFDNLAEEFAGKKKDDDVYMLFVRVVLIYFFESCIFGKRTEEEKHDNP